MHTTSFISLPPPINLQTTTCTQQLLLFSPPPSPFYYKYICACDPWHAAWAGRPASWRSMENSGLIFIFLKKRKKINSWVGSWYVATAQVLFGRNVMSCKRVSVECLGVHAHQPALPERSWGCVDGTQLWQHALWPTAVVGSHSNPAVMQWCAGWALHGRLAAWCCIDWWPWPSWRPVVRHIRCVHVGN